MKNKKYWLITSAITLLPILVGLLLWDSLPEKLPTHFGIDGTADGWSGKGFAVFGLPLLMLFFHIVLYFATRLDKQNRGHNEKVLNLMGLVFPAMSIVFSALIYTQATQLRWSMTHLLFPLLGLFFIALGNWMPKIKQNTTLGIKIKWTLYNEENWNKTHRFAGFCWVLGGLAMIPLAFLPADAFAPILPLILVLMVAAPMVYSWRLAKKQQREGTYTESQVSKNQKHHPVITAVSLVLVTLILLGVTVVMFTGDIAYTCTGDSLVIEADFWEDSTVPYGKIDSIEYRETAPDGTRQWGWGSMHLELGWFDNTEFGDHTRYTYTGTDAHIVIDCGEDILILNAADEAATEALYQELTTKIQEVTP